MRIVHLCSLGASVSVLHPLAGVLSPDSMVSHTFGGVCVCCSAGHRSQRRGLDVWLPLLSYSLETVALSLSLQLAVFQQFS